MKIRLIILIQLLLAGLYGSNLAATETPGNILVTATRIDVGNLTTHLRARSSDTTVDEFVRDELAGIATGKASIRPSSTTRDRPSHRDTRPVTIWPLISRYSS